MASSTCAGTEREFLNARGLVGRLRFGWVAAWAAVVEAKRHHSRASDTSVARDLRASERVPCPHGMKFLPQAPASHDQEAPAIVVKTVKNTVPARGIGDNSAWQEG